MLPAVGRKRSWTVFAVVVTCFLVVAGLATAVSAAPAHVSVSGMSVSDDEPTVGDSITVTPTIRHSSSGSGSFEVTQVTLEDASGTRYAEADDLGTLGAGDTIDVPLRTTVQSAGEKKFVVHVRGVQYDSDGKWSQVIHTRHPTYVTVSEPSEPSESTKPQLNVETERLRAGTESRVNVTVSNGGDVALSDLSLRLSGLGGMQNRTKLRPALGAHNSTTLQFTVAPPRAGTHSLNATLQYGDGESVEVSEDVEVAPVRDDATVYATVAERDGSPVLRYRVTNHGNAPLENVVVSGAATGTPFPTTVIRTVEPGTAETATVELNERPTGPATVSATYSIGSATGQVDQTLQFVEPAAASSTATATATPDGETQSKMLPLGPLSLLTGGVVATGSILGYRNWRDR